MTSVVAIYYIQGVTLIANNFTIKYIDDNIYEHLSVRKHLVAYKTL